MVIQLKIPKFKEKQIDLHNKQWENKCIELFSKNIEP